MVVAAAALTGAAPATVAQADADAQLLLLRDWDARVAGIAWRILTANRARCARQVPQTGLVVYAADQYAGAFQPVAVRLFHLARGPAIAAVTPGSAAARDGLRAGDVLTSIDGIPLPTAGDGAASFASVQTVHDRLEAALATSPARLVVLRDGQPLPVDLSADRGCPSFVQLVPSKKRDAEADGKTVTISSTVAEYAHDDDELATPIAHELAHNILGHRAALDRDRISKGLFAGVGANGRRLRATEDEADLTGVELMAAAGYDPAAAVRFWNRFGPASSQLLGDGTHRGWRARVAAIAAKVAAIRSGK